MSDTIFRVALDVPVTSNSKKARKVLDERRDEIYKCSPHIKATGVGIGRPLPILNKKLSEQESSIIVYVDGVPLNHDYYSLPKEYDGVRVTIEKHVLMVDK